MARKLSNKTNVQAPDSTYPYGRIQNDSGAGDGTPVDEVVYGDFHQFFEKLMAEGNITANGLPDNATNGFQLWNAAYNAFIKKPLEFNGFFPTTYTEISQTLSRSAITADENYMTL